MSEEMENYKTNTKEPFYKLQDEDKEYIIKLLKTCKEIDLGNVSFQYFAVPGRMYDVFFYLTQYASRWELVVKHERQDNTKVYWSFTDMHTIGDDEVIEYDYSEKDIL